MAHPQQFCFVQTFANHISASDSQFNILEIGSYDVNGSVRELFPGSTYCGVDLTPGEGVDVVADGHRVDHPNNSYDITISCECFEHNPAWLETFHNMYRMTKAGASLSSLVPQQDVWNMGRGERPLKHHRAPNNKDGITIETSRSPILEN